MHDMQRFLKSPYTEMHPVTAKFLLSFAFCSFGTPRVHTQVKRSGISCLRETLTEKEGLDFSNTDSYLQTMGKDWECVCFCAKGRTNVCLCGSCVYLAVQFFHGDEVQGLEGVSRRGDEIKADVDSGVVVVKQRAFNLQLFLEIVFKLSVDVVDDGLVTVETTEKL